MLNAPTRPDNLPPHPTSAGAPLGLRLLPERVLQTMPWGVLSLNNQGVVTLLNPYAARLLACDAATALGQPLRQLVPAGFPPELLAALLAARNATEPATGEYFLPYCQRWVEVGTEPSATELLVFWQDITRIKQKQQRFQTLAHNIPDVLTRWGPDLRLSYANPALADKTGQPLSALLGKTFVEMGAPAAIAEPYMAKIQLVFDTGQPVEHHNSFPTPHGERHYHSRLVPERLDGHVESVLAIAHDITAAQHAAAELRNTHDLLRSVLDSPNVGLSAFRAVRDAAGQVVDLEYQLVSRSHALTLGQPVQQGQRLLATHPEAHNYLARMRRVVETGLPDAYEVQMQVGSESKWFLNSNAKLDDGLVNVWVDITARKLAEQELRESKALLEAVFNVSTRGMYMLRSVPDAAGQLLDLEVLLANKLAETTAGRPLVGRRIQADQPYPWAVGGLFEDLTSALRTGQLVGKEYCVATDGAPEWFYWRAAPLHDGLVVTFENITARKQMQEALRESQELLQTVFNATPDSLEVLRSVRDDAGQLLDFEWVLTNAAAHRLLQRADLVGQRLLVQEPAMRTSGVFERLRQVADQQQATSFEQHYPFDGPNEWFHVTAAPLGDGVVVNWHDITVRKKAAAELLRLQLAQQQQLTNAVLDAQESERHRIAESLHNGLGQLLYATQLRLHALVATSSPETFAEAKRRAERLLQEAIAQTRTLSHQLTPTILQDFGLATAVQDICRDFSGSQLQLHSEVRVSPSLPPSLVLALYRMAQELLNNIAKHAHATEASLRLTQHEGWLEIRADDNGRGFDQTQPRTKGMGLNALRDRVQLLNGLLAITSSPQQGTHINIRIPLTTFETEPLLG